jgi:hypothetical protein
MKRTLLTLMTVVVLATMSFAQTIGGLSIGNTKAQVEKVYGKPDTIVIWEGGPDVTWGYDFGKMFVHVAFSKATERVTRLVAVGDVDRRGLFQTLHGVRLGDDPERVLKLYGKGKLNLDSSIFYTRTFSNIMFGFWAVDGKMGVRRIEVFPSPPKKPAESKKTAKSNKG